MGRMKIQFMFETTHQSELKCFQQETLPGCAQETSLYEAFLLQIWLLQDDAPQL